MVLTKLPDILSKQRFQTSFLKSFLGFLVCLLIIAFQSLSVEAHDNDDDDEGFCFTQLNGTTCEDYSNADVVDSIDGGVVTENALKVEGIKFKFRSYDEDEGEEWELHYHKLKCLDCKKNGNDFKDIELSDDQYRLEMIKPKKIYSWQEGGSGKITSDDDEDELSQYHDVELNLYIFGDLIELLQDGNHTIELTIHGDGGGQGKRHLVINVGFTVNPLVKISGLKNVPFGTFLAEGFSRSDEQPFCAHVQGGGNFKITPTSDNGSFELKGNATDKTIPYKVFVANIGQTFAQIDYGATKLGLRGEASENCTTLDGKNMQLKIELPEISVLSVMPASNYMDTLTLTIAAE